MVLFLFRQDFCLRVFPTLLLHVYLYCESQIRLQSQRSQPRLLDQERLVFRMRNDSSDDREA